MSPKKLQKIPGGRRGSYQNNTEDHDHKGRGVACKQIGQTEVTQKRNDSSA